MCCCPRNGLVSVFRLVIEDRLAEIQVPIFINAPNEEDLGTSWDVKRYENLLHQSLDREIII